MITRQERIRTLAIIVFFFLAWNNSLKQNGGEEKLVGLIPAWEGFEVERLVIAAVVALDQQFKRDR